MSTQVDLEHGVVKRAQNPVTNKWGWGFFCSHKGLCGIVGGPKFSTIDWPTQELAIKRGLQHTEEHLTGEVMQPLHEFREQNNLNEDGTLKADA